MVTPADKILDVLLDELLCGQTPPDLRDQILARAAGTARREEEFGDLAELPRGSRRGRLRPARRRKSAVAVVTAALVLLAAGIWLAWPERAVRRPQAARPEQVAEAHKEPVPTRRTAPAAPTRRAPLPDVEVPFAKRLPRPQRKEDARPPEERVVVEPWPDDRIVAAIEAGLRTTWKRAGIEPSPRALDSIWCRRLYVRLLGRIPTVDELQVFLKWPEARRRRLLIDRLAASEDYRAEWVDHWSLYWMNLTIGRQGGLSDDRADREGMLAFWREALSENRPWDVIARRILTAEGTNRPGAEDFDGAVNYWLVHATGDGIRTTSHAARLFLGERIDCLRCHDRPRGEGRQEDYWSINPFFRLVRAESVGEGVVRLRTVPAAETDTEIFFERPDGRLAVVVPRFPDGRDAAAALRRDPRAARRELARQWTRSPQFARAAVNRLWTHFFGFGLARSVDDVGPGAPIDHPQLLEMLAAQFAAHDYDLHRLATWLVASDAFGRSSRQIDANERDAPERGTVAYFSRYYARPLAPEAVYESLMLALRRGDPRRRDERVEARRVWMGQWAKRRGTDEGGEISLFDGGVGQSLQLMNGQLMRRVTSAEEAQLLKKLAASRLPPSAKVEHLFLAALARKPSRKELRAALHLIEQNGADATSPLEDIWWALLNSNEFLLDH